MSDKDREAFEIHYDAKYTPGYAYPTSHRLHAWEDWQAAFTKGWNEAMNYAREVNAPTLTKKQATDIACKTYAKQQKAMGYGHYPVERGSTIHQALAAAIEDLKAAGVRFAEEA